MSDQNVHKLYILATLSHISDNQHMSYIHFGERETPPEHALDAIQAYYEGYVYTRTKRNHMERVRSVRVNLSQFEASSENRRILRKYSDSLQVSLVPFEGYSWEIHKLGKDFYDTKFGVDTFSANKIKELFTSEDTNFNYILTFSDESGKRNGYCITHISQAGAYKADTQNATELHGQKIIHYAYPFYQLDLINSSYGMYMMTKTIEYFKDQGFDYVYLGSAHEPASLYKFQFKGIEWYDEQTNCWSIDKDSLKKRILEA